MKPKNLDLIENSLVSWGTQPISKTKPLWFLYTFKRNSLKVCRSHFERPTFLPCGCAQHMLSQGDANVQTGGAIGCCSCVYIHFSYRQKSLRLIRQTFSIHRLKGRERVVHSSSLLKKNLPFKSSCLCINHGLIHNRRRCRGFRERGRENSNLSISLLLQP